MRLAGIDGCKGGWVAVLTDTGDLADATICAVPDLAAFVQEVDFAVIDMPIGLVNGPEPRDVDLAIRVRLKGKASSVFPTPSRRTLDETSYFDASFLNRQAMGKGLSKQTFMLFPKLNEVDRVARQLGQVRLREGHPEVSFAELAGSPVLSRKRNPDGASERLSLLARAGVPVEALLRGALPHGSARDDVLDAAAMLWTAARFQRGVHVTYPPTPSLDSTGLEMTVIA